MELEEKACLSTLLGKVGFVSACGPSKEVTRRYEALPPLALTQPHLHHEVQLHVSFTWFASLLINMM